MVPFSHAEMLYPKLRDPHPPLWIDNAGHHDMPDDVCLRAVADFVAFVEARNARRYPGGETDDDRGWFSGGFMSSLFGGAAKAES